MTTLYQIDTGHECFGIEATNGIVTRAAQIAEWTVGKRINYVLNFYRIRKGSTVTIAQESANKETA